MFTSYYYTCKLAIKEITEGNVYYDFDDASKKSHFLKLSKARDGDVSNTD